MICGCQNINSWKFKTGEWSSLICFLPIALQLVMLRFAITMHDSVGRFIFGIILGSSSVSMHVHLWLIFYARRVEQASTAQHSRSWALQRDHTCLTISPKHKTLSTLCDVPNHLIKKRQKGNERFLSAARVSKEIGTVPTRHSIPFHPALSDAPSTRKKKTKAERNRKIIDFEGENLIFCSPEITAQRLMMLLRHISQ